MQGSQIIIIFIGRLLTKSDRLWDNFTKAIFITLDTDIVVSTTTCECPRPLASP